MPKLDERLAAAELEVKQLKIRQRQLDARKRSIATKNQRNQDARQNIAERDRDGEARGRRAQRRRF